MTHYIRKRDGQRYTTDLKVVRLGRWGECYVLHPIWEGRTHYKTVAAFDREFRPAVDEVAL